MTISNTASSVTVLGNGTQTQFNYGFLIPVGSAFALYYEDASGSVTTLDPSTYAVNGVGNATGGTFEYPLNGGTPIAAGTSLTLTRDVPEEQETSLGNQGAYYPAVIEGALDWIVMQIQDLARKINRAVVMAPVDAAVPRLVSAKQRANTYLAFDSNGNPIASPGASGSVPISTTMLPVVQAATLADAATAMGVAEKGGSAQQAFDVGPATGLTNAPAASQTPLLFASVADLRANSTPWPSIVLEGFASPTDGAGGLFLLDSADTSSADNGGTVFVDQAGNRFKRAFTGALKISWFGGRPDGSDTSAALSSALAALPTGGGSVEFGPGEWTFAAEVTYAFPAVAPTDINIFGASASATSLRWGATNGLSLSASDPTHAFHLRDLSFVTSGAGAGKALILTQSAPQGNFGQNDIYRVTFKGASSSEYWTTAVDIVGWSNINYDGLLVYADGASSTGVALKGNTAASPYFSTVHNFSKCGFFGCGSGISYGTYVQGVTIDQCNFTNGTNGIAVTGGANLSQLAVTASQFGVTGVGVYVTGAINEVLLQGNLFIPNATGTAVLFSSSGKFHTIVGNVFAASGNTSSGGVAVTGATTDAVVIGNVFQGLNAAVNLAASSAQWNVQANHYANCTNTVLNGGTGNSIGVATS